MYEHINEQSRERGKPAARAEEIAARTVNKKRREEGRTPNKTTQGTGNPNESLSARTKAELMNIAREMNLSGRSAMNKDELVKAMVQTAITRILDDGHCLRPARKRLAPPISVGLVPAE